MSRRTQAHEQSPIVTGGRARLAFRPDIEGLRPVAVGMVVLLHAGATPVSGGYVGVDVFFVISGFLITSLLIDESRSPVSGGYVGVDVFFVISGFLITSLLIDESRSTGRLSIVGFYARPRDGSSRLRALVACITVVAARLRSGAT